MVTAFEASAAVRDFEAALLGVPDLRRSSAIAARCGTSS